MSDFFDREPLSKWRLVFYGCFAAVGVAALGLYFHDRGMLIAAVFCGAFVGGFGFLLSWTRAKGRSFRIGTGEAKATTHNIVQYLRVVVILGLLIRIVLSFLHKK